MNKFKLFFFYLISFGAVFGLGGFYLLGWKQISSIIAMLFTAVIFASLMTVWNHKKIASHH